MKTFPLAAVTKPITLAGLAHHREIDAITKGAYWQDGKGCAVGCTLEGVRLALGYEMIDHGAHNLYETYLGVPLILARLEDCIFEGLANEDAMAWPTRFMEAVPVGADLAMVWPHFALWLLTEEVPQHTKRPKALAALADVAALYKEWCEGAKPATSRWLKARDAAAYAAYAAADAAAYAAAADAAAYAADAAADAADDARANHYTWQAELLISLLKKAGK